MRDRVSQKRKNTFWGQLVYNFCIPLKAYSSKKSNSNLHPVFVGIAMLLVDKSMNMFNNSDYALDIALSKRLCL